LSFLFPLFDWINYRIKKPEIKKHHKNMVNLKKCGKINKIKINIKGKIW